MQHALLPVVGSELVLVRHKLSLLRGRPVGHRGATVLRGVDDTLGVHCSRSIYFHGTTGLAVALGIAALVLAALTAFLVQGAAEGVLVVGPLLLNKGLIYVLWVSVVIGALHLSIYPLLVI